MATNGVKKPERRQSPLFESLRKCLPLRSDAEEYWWQLTGYHVASMVEAADYPVDKQYETLLFHYHWIIPRLGPAPGSDGVVKFKSMIGIEGSPLEYSWRWNSASSKPDIRYSWEPINELSGTDLDPLNHRASLDYMNEIANFLPGLDFSWAHHFRAHLFDHDLSKYVKEKEDLGVAPRSTFLHAVEYLPSGLSLKSYFLPRWLDQGTTPGMQRWDDAIMKLDPSNSSRDILMNYLRTTPEGQTLLPVVLAMDDINPSKSRLKLYFTTPHTSFASVRKIMTLGGLINVPESQMQDLRSFIGDLLGLPADYPEDAEVPASSKWIPEETIEAQGLISGYVYFFDIAPGTSGSAPGVKFYLPTRRYGPDDQSIAQSLMNWMTVRGRGKYCEPYLKALESIAEHRGLGDGKGLHTYISYMFAVGHADPDVKSYLCPDAYHSARFRDSGK